MKRRSFLAMTGTSLTALSAGCSCVRRTFHQRDYKLGIYNGSREPHSFRVRIGNDVDGYFQEERFEMDSTTANEEILVDEVPSRLYIEIRSYREREFPWPASTDELGKIADKADVWYEPALEQEIWIEEG